MERYTGMTYQTESGQWTWIVYERGVDVARGADYESQDEADEALQVELEQCRAREAS